MVNFKQKVILVYGLPGSGKTTFSKELEKRLENSSLIHADNVRKDVNYENLDLRGNNKNMAFHHMKEVLLAKHLKKLIDSKDNDYVIVDFVAPTKESRTILCANVGVWLDTIQNKKYKDTTNIFSNYQCDKTIKFDKITKAGIDKLCQNIKSMK